MRNGRQFACSNRFSARQADDKGLLRNFQVDVRRNRTKPRNKGEVENGGHGKCSVEEKTLATAMKNQEQARRTVYRRASAVLALVRQRAGALRSPSSGAG